LWIGAIVSLSRGIKKLSAIDDKELTSLF
jgi:hypothetical protein